MKFHQILKKLKPILERRTKKKGKKGKSLLVILAVVAAISIVSYNTVSQLTNKAGSDSLVVSVVASHARHCRFESTSSQLAKYC